MSASATRPQIGGRFNDAMGRALVVEEVNVGDQQGREVVGWLEWTPSEGHPDAGVRRRDSYSCTLEMWARTWRDRVPPVPVSQQTGSTA